MILFDRHHLQSATHIDDFIYVVGGLGYQGSREFGVTPIYRLNCKTWNIEAVRSTGENPGWIYKHKARLVDSNVLVVSGGETFNENDGEEQHVENGDQFSLDISDMTWTKI